MALSDNANLTIASDDVVVVPVQTGYTLYSGSLCQAHAATGGSARPYDGTIGAMLLGWHFGSAADDGTSSPTYTAKLQRGGFIFYRLTVAGLANATTDTGKKVYATDDGTYSVTSITTHQVQVGNVIRSYSTTVADVLTVNNIYGTLGV